MGGAGGLAVGGGGIGLILVLAYVLLGGDPSILGGGTDPATLAGVAVGAVALAVVAGGALAVVRIAVGEVRYRASDPDAWLKWIK